VDTLEQAKGKSLYPLIAPEYRQAFRKLTEEVFLGRPGTLVFKMTGIKGRRLWLDTHAVPLRNDKDEIIALLGITRDITGQKKAVEELKKERDFVSTVLDTAGSMVLVLERDGRIVRFNRACEVVSGYAFEEVQGRFVWDFLLTPEQVERVKKVFGNLTSGMFPSKYENYWVAKDGQQKLIAWSNSVLLAEDGSVEYVIATGIDITEHRKAERALLEEKIFSDVVIDSLPGLFYIVDESRNLIRWNKNFQEVTGYSPEELANMKVLDFFQEDRELIRSKIHEVFHIGSASVEAKMVTKSGVSISFMMTGFRMITNDKPYLVGVGIDLSERKLLEAQLRQSQKMESIGTLAGGISHDFNNILTAIIGYGSLLQMQMRDDDPLKHNVEQILASANRAASLTQGLLAYSRRQVLNPRRVNLNDIILKVERLLAVTNARDAMPDGGYVYIETRVVELDEASAKAHDIRKPGAYAQILVTDSGMGMDQKTQERIFEPFFTTKEVGKGTGLGLAMVYGIIKQHNGFIEVESGIGRGTTLKIYLPVAPPAKEEVLPGGLPVTKRGMETILVAEDDEGVRKLIASVLTQFGYSVIQAEDGEAAVKKFMASRDTIKLLVLDVMMPKKSGKEVYDKIRIFEPDMKALFISGYTSDIMNQKGLLDKGVNFVHKPIPVNNLLRKVRDILDGK
jgi:two-component system cell cycle sensor histidine kinase/response regulator CckA